MAKNNLFSYPADITRKKLDEEYTLVTDKNKDILIVHGRIFYVIRPKDAKYSLCAWIDMRPRLRKGWLTIKGWPTMPKEDYVVFVKEEEHIDDYKEFGQLITNHIKNNILYIKKQEALIKYTRK